MSGPKSHSAIARNTDQRHFSLAQHPQCVAVGPHQTYVSLIDRSTGFHSPEEPTHARYQEYTPPKVWTWNKANGGQFANINRPIAGPTHDKELPVGKHPLQLYSLGTPNGVKVTIMLEELLALGHSGAEYDAWLIKIGEGDQFGSGFVAVNPNSKIPALVDRSGNDADPRVRIRRDPDLSRGEVRRLPADRAGRRAPRCLSWLFWQMGSAPFLGGGFGHFYAYAPDKIEYAIDRYAMETKRQLDVLDRRLAESEYIAGSEYTIADMAIWPWYGGLVKGWQLRRRRVPGGARIQERHALGRPDRMRGRRCKRGRMVNRTSGEPGQPAARAPRRQRFRHEDAGQDRGGLGFPPWAAAIAVTAAADCRHQNQSICNRLVGNPHACASSRHEPAGRPFAMASCRADLREDTMRTIPIAG